MAGKYLTRTIKTTLIAVFTFQLLSTVERQVFDFLGYMWAPIIGNFFQIIAVIVGLFGACQQYRSFVVAYAIWSLLWLGWNIFVICLYLEVGILNRNSGRYILTIGTESKSWWLEHGIGCMITNSTWIGGPPASLETGRPIPPEEFVEGCILQYYYVEVIHAAVQVLLSLVGLVTAFVIIYTYLEEEDACKYLLNHSTYARPLGPVTTLSLSRASPLTEADTGGGDSLRRVSGDQWRQNGGTGGGYQPVSIRDSWCVPTYVSYHDSMEWSGSFTGEQPRSSSSPYPTCEQEHTQHLRPVSDSLLLEHAVSDCLESGLVNEECSRLYSCHGFSGDFPAAELDDKLNLQCPLSEIPDSDNPIVECHDGKSKNETQSDSLNSCHLSKRLLNDQSFHFPYRPVSEASTVDTTFPNNDDHNDSHPKTPFHYVVVPLSSVEAGSMKDTSQSYNYRPLLEESDIDTKMFQSENEDRKISTVSMPLRPISRSSLSSV